MIRAVVILCFCAVVPSGCAGVQRWTSPIAVKNRIVAGGNGRLCAWRLP